MRPRLTILAVACAGLLLAACRNKPRTPVAITSTEADSAEQVMYGVKTVLHDHGIKRGDLISDTAYVYNDQTRFVFKNARATFTKETGAPNGTMRADRGVYDLRLQLLEGFGNVVITTTDGKRLTSPHLKFDQARNEVSSDTSFVLVDGERRQAGIGFISDPNLTRMRCLKACSGSGTFSIPAQ